MEFGLTKEFLLLLALWALFGGALIVFLRGSSWGSRLANRLLGVTPPLESQAGYPDEKRLYQRKRLPLGVTYSVLEKPDTQGTVLSSNVSKGGVCVPLPAALENGSRLRLSIQLPREMNPFSIWGKVVWQTPLAPAPKQKYDTGIQFIELTSAHILTIARSL